MPDNFVRCIKHMEDRNVKLKKKYNPYAVCRVSTGFKGSTKKHK